MKKIRVLVSGIPNRALLLAEQINSFNQGVEVNVLQHTGLRSTISQLNRADVFHGIFWENCYKTYFIAKLLGKKTLCHWIGTDVFNVLRDRKRKLAVKLLDKLIDAHIAGSPGLVEELKTIDIEASWIPSIPPDNSNTQVQLLPTSFTVLSFLPDERSEFYGASIVRQLAEDFKDIKFLIVGGTGAGVVSPPNMTYLGWQKDMSKVYDNTTVLLRIVEHDGLSLMVREALARGRQVIWSEPFPHCHHAKDFNVAKSALSSIMKNPVINNDGANYVQEEFNITKIMGKLAKVYTGLIH
jgi:hypothetical protein